MFKQKLKEKAYKSFDKLIVDPSFIKNTAPIKPAPRILSSKIQHLSNPLQERIYSFLSLVPL